MMRHKLREKLKEFKNTMSFSKRLFASFFAVMIPLLVVISVFFYIFMNKSSKDSTANMMLQVLEQTKGRVEYIFSETEYLSRNIIYDEDVQKMLKEAADGNAYPEEQDVKYFINSFIVNREYMDSVVLLSHDNTVFSTEKATTSVSSMENMKKKWWFSYLDALDQPFQWFTSAKDEQKQEKYPKSMMLTRIIRSTDDYKTPLGRMMIYLNEAYVEDIWSDIQWGKTLNVWVLDENQEILCQNVQDKDYFECLRSVYDSENFDRNKKIYSEVIKYEGKSYVAGAEKFDNHQWSIIMIVPLAEVAQNRSMIYFQICIMVLMTLLIIVIAGFVISRNVSRPVECISEIMDSYHDHRDEEADYDKSHWQKVIRTFEMRNDEIGKIYRSYEQMVQRVDYMIKEMYIKDLEKKDAELALMQSQINPHFLYNTLDSINWLAMVNGQDEISEMVTALSDTFRLSLRRSNSPYIKISQEMEYIDSYMVLQKIRFEDRLQYVSVVSDDARELYMLRFVLQPIIENAIKHGISSREQGGKIEISFEIDGDRLIVDIVNDGAEIDIQQMENILSFDTDTDTFLNFKQQGYGLQNINRRIKIVHGVSYGVRYFVIDGEKTLCRVTLPVIEKDVEAKDYTNKYAGGQGDEVSVNDEARIGDNDEN